MSAFELLRQWELDKLFEIISRWLHFVTSFWSIYTAESIMEMRSERPEVHEVLSKFIISDDVLLTISAKIEAEMKAGLTSDGGSSIAMLPSYVPALPDGSEEGQYVAIDLSGKNLRIMLLTLKGTGREPTAVNNNYVVPNHVMKGTGDQLFTFIVNCLQRFLQEFGLVEANLPIGFVFSYPCELLSIRSARLLWWTKGFDIKDCLQKDVVSTFGRSFGNEHVD
ncbi:hypothetical protein KIN20_017626 [Parelaphostrongylus tenuis]|uniref:Phosphotransferase n=1 Tax=Parelaphostrongylus tenuis TaxID=148309 RepID=A0AAD5N060_PARTN|nr:hypothetical protein KIN20_017626 [Parelaphostrongylus tenuis]